MINLYLYFLVQILLVLWMKLKNAFISPLFFEHSFKKLFIIFNTKNILLFLIKSKKKFFKFLEKFNFSDNKLINYFDFLHFELDCV